jgi:hypothetical protein
VTAGDGSCACGCNGTTPRANPPGRTELAYRVGTWSSFRARMLRALPTMEIDGEVDGERPLAALTTRTADDPTIALVDAFACVCDVLTFYQERILDEGYLTTAVQPRSVTELAAAIGYHPAPGLAATARLAFTVDPVHAGDVAVPAGLPVQSVPASSDDQPVTFETGEDLVARAEWNALLPRPSRAQAITAGTTTLSLAGVATRLTPGAPVAVLGSERRDAAVGTADVSERWDLRQVAAVAPDAAAGRTIVTLDRALGDGITAPAAAAVEVVTFDERGGLFGWNAPDVRMMSDAVRGNAELVTNGTQWAGFGLEADRARLEINPRALDLDLEYPSAVAGGWVCLQGSRQVELYRVVSANPAARTDFSLTGRITRVFLDTAEHLDDFNRRGTTVLLASRTLPLAPEPDPEPVSGYAVELSALVATPLPEGRAVLVTGVSADTGETLTIPTTVADWADDVLPVVTFADELPRLVRDTVVIRANVATATHGTSVRDEVLGSADATAAGQRFRLRQGPLTWLPRPPAGADPALELRVNGLLWEPVESLYGAGPTDRVYTLVRDPDGVTAVELGDGVHGARAPSGTENIRATYRVGIGLGGLAGAGALALLQNRPPGLVGVTNPAAAAGAADPDAAADVRRLAPGTVLTLDRLVSLQDYEDFAAAFPGIGKAGAVSLWDGRRGFVHLTVATADGRPPGIDDPAVAALNAAIEQRGDPAHHVVVSAHDEVTFGVTLGVVTDPAYLATEVLDAVRAALVAAFSFAARGFGQAVASAEVVATAQAVPGVVAVDLDRLAAADGRPAVRGVLPVASPTWDGSAPTRAELLLLGPGAADCVLTPLEDT